MDRYDVYVLTRDGIRETECIEYEEDGDGRFVFYEDHLADRETYGDERVQEERERIVALIDAELRDIQATAYLYGQCSSFATLLDLRAAIERGDHLTPPAGGEG
jgi:hypothetical protein